MYGDQRWDYDLAVASALVVSHSLVVSKDEKEDPK